MNGNLGGWVNRIVGWCFSILAGVVALYCAVKIILAVWPTLVTIIGIVCILAIILRVVVYYTSQKF